MRSISPSVFSPPGRFLPRVSRGRSAWPRELKEGEFVRVRGIAHVLRVLRRIDAGSHSTVYAAKLRHQSVALGVVLHTEQLVRSFSLQRAAQSPNVVKLLTYVRDGQAGFWLAEHVVGGALDNLLLQARLADVELPLIWRIHWFRQAVEAICVCHARGIVHYDVAAQNFFVTQQTPAAMVRAAQRHQQQLREGQVAAQITLGTKTSAPASIKLGDFSLASRAEVADGRGTISSLPPEALWGLKSGKGQDLFALGCLLFTLVLGSEPYDDASEEAVARALIENHPALDESDLNIGLRMAGADAAVSATLASLGAALTAREPHLRPSAQAVRLVLNDLFG